MIIINLEVNLQFKKKKDVSKKNVTTKEKPEKERLPGEEPDEEFAIYYSPNINQITQVLLRPLEQFLVESVNSINRLEKDLVPLVDIDQNRQVKGRTRAYEMENDPDAVWLQVAKEEVISFIQIGY